MTDMGEIKSLMYTLNQNYKNHNRYVLEVKVNNITDNSPIGVVKKLRPNSKDEYVFVPGEGYEPYAPTDRGE